MAAAPFLYLSCGAGGKSRITTSFSLPGAKRTGNLYLTLESAAEVCVKKLRFYVLYKII